jgi:hypothetical protein
MYIGVVFWILMILWAVFGGMGAYTPAGQPSDRRFVWGGMLLLFVLLALLGWHDFGAALHN